MLHAIINDYDNAIPYIDSITDININQCPFPDGRYSLLDGLLFEHSVPLHIIEAALKKGAKCLSTVVPLVDRDIFELLLNYNHEGIRLMKIAKLRGYYDKMHLIDYPPGKKHSIIVELSRQIIKNSELLNTYQSQLDDCTMYKSFYELCHF